MKTAILTIFSVLVLVSGIAENTYAATSKNETVTVLTDIKSIDKIEVYGNVELFISDGPADEVKVYNKYYAEHALVQNKNGVLRISSYKAEKLVVWVTAYDLRSIAAYDNAVVNSFGNLSKIELNVDLYNNAAAKLKMDAFSANVNVHDQAKANLSGSATEFNLRYSHIENVNEVNLAVKQGSKTNTTLATVKKTELDELANL
jgi:hypothetical protein